MRYTVIALSVGGANKLIYNSGDEVSTESFPPGRAEQLEKEGFLKALDAIENVPAPVATEVKIEPVVEVPSGSETPKEIAPVISEVKNPAGEIVATVSKTDSATMKKSFEDITVKELRHWLVDNNIEFPSTANKESLYALYIK